MRKRKETTFLYEIKKAADALEIYYHKLPDSLFHTGSEARFSPVKRYDFYLIKKPRVIACEAKVTDARLAFTSLRKTEEEWLLKYEEVSKYPAFIVVNFRKGKEYNKSFYVRILDFIDTREKLTRKSLTLDMMYENVCENYTTEWVELGKVKVDNKSYWNLNKIMGSYE